MSSSSATPPRGAWFGGEHGAQFGGAEGSNFGLADSPSNVPVIQPRGAWFGGEHGAWFGTRHGANHGIPSPPVGSLFSEDGISIVLERSEKAGGGTRALSTVESAQGSLTSLDISLEANEVSDWEALVPGDSSLEQWIRADVHVGFGGDRLYHGTLMAVHGDQPSQETRLYGFGPADALRDGDLSVTYQSIEAHAAIREFLREYTPNDLRWRIVTPPGGHSRLIKDLELSGTPLDILESLCEHAGMIWSVDHSEREPWIEVFRPGIHSVREATWRTLEWDREFSVEGYANEVVVHGAIQDPSMNRGERFSATARDETEIREITHGEPIVYRVVDDDLRSEADCQSRAESILDEKIGERTLGGSVTATPTTVQPGLYYRVEEFEGKGIATPGGVGDSSSTTWSGAGGIGGESGGEATSVYLPLYAVHYSESLGDASAELSFEAQGGMPGYVRRALRGRGEMGLGRVITDSGREGEGAEGFGAGPFGEGPFGL